ncbi:MAG TPA: M20/M25/M40 family metallo-hydrolase [Candidatus Binatus sp.]|nr:M20/M25/M40 family metallo-hydrolase [Candidatus Binatus sp.]
MKYLPAGLLWMTILFSGMASSFAAEGKIDWRSAEDEAIALLSRYIQIDTINPPGNEIKAAQFFKAIFDKEGIESRIIESQPGRGNIFARLKGNGTKKSLVLLNHMDVVPAEASLWKEPPFSGLVKDGVIWGRGSLDDKGAAIMELAAMLALKRQGVSLRGDLIFLGSADEEAGGALGAGYLLGKHFELFKDVGLVLNEGGGIRVDEAGRARIYNVSVAEKTPLWLKLTATGTPGHGSTPSGNMAVNKLITALNRITSYQTAIKVVSEVQRYYADTAMNEAPERRERYQDLGKALEDPIFRTEFLKDPRNAGNVRNTIAVTAIKGSDKTNVIPAFATAELDVRLLPGESPEVFIKDLQKVIADESIKIEILLSFPAATSPPHAEALKVINEFAKSHDPGAPVVAPLVRGFTDCHFFREKGIPCLGFMPHRSTPSSEGLVHGVDERASLDSLRFGIRAMYEIVGKLLVE